MFASRVIFCSQFLFSVTHFLEHVRSSVFIQALSVRSSTSKRSVFFALLFELKSLLFFFRHCWRYSTLVVLPVTSQHRSHFFFNFRLRSRVFLASFVFYVMSVHDRFSVLDSSMKQLFRPRGMYLYNPSARCVL